MQKFEVTVTETLQKTVIIDANNGDEAQRLIAKKWFDEPDFFNANDCIDVCYDVHKSRIMLV